MAKRIDKDCFNCGEPLETCECGETETYDNSEGPICPFCGHMNKACDSDGRLYNEELDEYDCEDCGKTFNLSVGLSVGVRFSWSASKPD